MLEYFCEWIQKIAYYMILVTLVMQVTAGESYRKYIRLFTGIILILLILSPVVRLFGSGGENDILSAESEYEVAAEQIEEKIEKLEEEASAASWTETAGEPGETGTMQEAGKIEVGEIRIGR